MKINKYALQIAREKRLADIVIQMCFLTTVLVLNGKYGFGKKRLTEFSQEFSRTMTDYRNRYDDVTLEALTKHAKAKGIEVDWV